MSNSASTQVSYVRGGRICASLRNREEERATGEVRKYRRLFLTGPFVSLSVRVVNFSGLIGPGGKG